ncbi:MAG: SDR family NAD(P)-dependent oxidoreductase, partial [Ignavibacteriae bacterium]|nr:SDR family NAD(P)-dependent oxidoreductase [Ignavibacteriota bacterium]
MKNLKGKISFVTGASSGFGEATAYKLAGIGMNLIICARRFDRIKKIASDIKKKYKVKVLPLKLDVRSYKEVKDTIKKLPAQWKKIEVLINNAGLSRGLNKIQDGVLLDWEEMIDTNVKGLLYVTKEIIPLMLENKSGHIVNVGSIAGHELYVAGNVYCATKHAVDALTKGMRMDLNGTPIKVSTVDPGLAETEFSVVRFRGDKKRAESVYKGLTPLYAEDIAEAIEYIVTRNDDVNVAEMILLPKAQESCSLVH